MIKQIKEIKRQDCGYWKHPDLPTWEEDTCFEDIKKWGKKNHIEIAIIDFEDNASLKQVERYFEEGISGFLDWEPIYEKENTFELCYYESEYGPHLMYAIKTKKYLQLEIKEKIENF